MSIKSKYILNVPFNSVPFLEERLTATWIEHRLNLFERYLLASLKAQSCQDFTALLLCDPVSMDTITACLAKRVSYPDNILFISSKDVESYIRTEITGCDYYYNIRIDSDNSYHKDFIQKLHDYVPTSDNQAILCQNGYIYNHVTEDIYSVYIASPSFYALIYPVTAYLKGLRYPLPIGHSSVIDLNCSIIDDFSYIVNVHETNVCFSQDYIKNYVNAFHFSKVIDPAIVTNIKSEFGLQY